MTNTEKIKWNKHDNFIYTSKCGRFAVDNSLQDSISATISDDVLSLATTDCSLLKKTEWSKYRDGSGTGTVKYAKEHCQIIFDLIEQGQI